MGKYEDLNLAVLHGYNLNFNGFFREYAPLDHVKGNNSYRYSGARPFIILYKRHNLWRLRLLTSVSHPLQVHCLEDSQCYLNASNH